MLADEQTRMASLGEVDFVASVKGHSIRVRALVMERLQADCFAGTTFHADNDVQARIRTGEIIFRDKITIKQSNPHNIKKLYPPPQDVSVHAISLPFSSVTYPGEYLDIPLYEEISHVNHISITPSFPQMTKSTTDQMQWAPQICKVSQGKAKYKNTSRQPIIAPKYSHFKPHHFSTMKQSEALVSQSKPVNPKEMHQSPNETQANIREIKINMDVLSKHQLKSEFYSSSVSGCV